ncbi:MULTISPECIES: ribosome recycling factor [Marinobacter]|uniref:Ribosome-recycling factor n=1 Tax=Marinobacter xestospongiae TaxID=994319 RepID=A0ABU3VTR3_9GAMM|nr:MULTISPECIES: ribosome recycling factor [Marinobacter]MCG8516797.1 ribosome recycling factor [Pseudomonadales bacterium]MCK7566506.1 ribosome recycling factor [Marinobacter xestospongiae]MDV2077670.1 ribosome recycling factor [Marinobacter xestospongiae]UDL06634.1 ribosome recycling factor [Marinobacter sp. CA1]
MINEIKSDAETRMKKSLEALGSAFNKIRTGRAHPAILDSVMVSYYGQDTPLKQVAAVNVEDNRTLVVAPWEKNLTPTIEKAIMMSDLGLNPSTNGDVIRVPMPMLTEETRREMVKQAKADAEHARVSIRNARRDANNDIKDLVKEKEISEDDQRRGEEEVQKLTDRYVAEVEKMLKSKEEDLMAV